MTLPLESDRPSFSFPRLEPAFPVNIDFVLPYRRVREIPPTSRTVWAAFARGMRNSMRAASPNASLPEVQATERSSSVVQRVPLAPSARSSRSSRGSGHVRQVYHVSQRSSREFQKCGECSKRVCPGSVSSRVSFRVRLPSLHQGCVHPRDLFRLQASAGNKGRVLSVLKLAPGVPRTGPLRRQCSRDRAIPRDESRLM